MSGRSNRLTYLLIVLSILCALLLASAPAVQAASQPLVVVEVFKEDRVSLDIGATTHVTRTVIIQNEINKSIVPGMITLVLQKQTPDKIGPVAIPFTSHIVPLNVTNAKAHLGDGTVISDVRVSESENSTTIQYGAWVPIEPGQSLTVVLEYDSPDMVEQGLLFSSVQYPFTSSSIPVEKAVVEASVPGSHVTYSSETPTVSNGLYTWVKDDPGMEPWSVSFEYSILPLPLLPISGGALLWGIILLLCLIWVVWTYTRPRKRP
ncbi:MAG TPA: hypothetical protein VMC84_13515 [Methanocella sp.]|uniref:hypothetical protein n=1 Tax=Methanocella sp. TaxID=2052833 RepID=UPI002B633DCD|nr:hypothetical protein [Methanocella sp.]HTY92188.1 hypothetical protein [Methanocella sp.]